MSAVSSILGIDFGDVLATAVPAALQLHSNNNALQIAQLNLQSQAAQTERATAGAASNANQTRLLVTGGLVLTGAVVAYKVIKS